MSKRKAIPKRKAKRARSSLSAFRPYVSRWFRKTFKKPSPAQDLAWPAIRRGENTLLLAPTGSGKTLAAFMCAIDDLAQRLEKGKLFDGIHVLYITPLKALGNDIHKNLLEPLAGIREEAGGDLPEIRVAVRSGDTPQNERQRMIRTPPHILITTPESLFLLLGSQRMAPNLAAIRTVIVDEVHALCSDKRGVHLALSLERLAERIDRPFQRIGCSATLRPLEDIAAFLVGYDEQGKLRPCTILNAGIRKDLDVQVMAPLPDFLEASNTALWSSAYELLLDEISKHTTTLVFCNSRYKAERASLRMGELAEEQVKIRAHHGSMSKEIRLDAEDDLKAGKLDALIATASLELGIDIGSIDLVYQMESPKSVATGLQRIGRAGHLLDATSKGRVLIFDRDELVEAAAICRAMLAGEVDAVRIPQGCFDVLAQQIVGAVAAHDWNADDLFALMCRAYPYRELTRDRFDAILGMLAGDYPFAMPRPPRPQVLWDRVSGLLSATRGSKQVAAMNVGTIPESAEYEVVIESTKKRVGTLEANFVDDCLRRRDVFVLGSTAWRVVGVHRNRLLVAEAPGSTPTVPWWLGPIAPRTAEAGVKVGRLRREIAERLADPDLLEWLQREYCLCPNAATALADYVREQNLGAGMVPDHERFLVETWADELGRLNVILHCPLGERINRTWGTAIAAVAKTEFRQDWTVTASNDVLLLARHPKGTAPLKKVDAEALLGAVTSQALDGLVARSLETAASFTSSFRHAAVCALQVLRARNGRRVPFWLQTHRAQELFEVAGGCRDYPVVREVLRGYLDESLDVPGLRELLDRIAAGEVDLVFKEVESPSPFAHTILIQGRYQEEGGYQMGRGQRAHLLRLHREVLQQVLSEEQMAQLLDVRAIERLERQLLHRSEISRAQSSDELAQAIRELGDLPASTEAVAGIVEGNAVEMLTPLIETHRVVGIEIPNCEQDPQRLVAADLWRQHHDALALGHAARKLTVQVPRLEDGKIVGFKAASATKLIPAKWRKKQTQAEARRAIVERFLSRRGPVTVYEVVNHTGWPIGAVEGILKDLEDTGTVARGVYRSDKPRPQWVNKANLEEIHRLTMGYLRRELAACAPYEVVDFVTRWQRLHPAARLEGLDGLREVIAQLQGIELIQGALETEILPGRVADYRPEMLDRLIASGEVRWGRVSTQKLRRGMISLCLRKDMGWIASGAPLEFHADEQADVDIPDQIAAVREFFRHHGSAFFDDVVAAPGVEEGAALRAVWHLVWCGELTCDTYECLRHADFEVTLSACYDLMSTPRKIVSGREPAERVVERIKKRRLEPRLGRWTATERLVPPVQPLPEIDIVRRWVHLLLKRWGIVSRDILGCEVAAPPWAVLVRELKRLELLGKVSRGYFIESHQGEQYGLPEAIELLRDCRARRSDGQEFGYLPDEPIFAVSNRDPANLYTSSLEIIEERGDALKRHQRQGSFTERAVVQAGQVLLFAHGDPIQLVTLTRRQLIKCIEQLTHNYAGRAIKTAFGKWNGHPIDASPVASVLWDQGFRFGNRGRLCWPPTTPGKRRPPESKQDLFPPHYEEASPVDYGPAHTVSRAPEGLRAALSCLFDILLAEFDREGWLFNWKEDWPRCIYRDGLAHLVVAIRQRWANVWIRTKHLRLEGRPRQFKWGRRIETPSQLDDAFISDLRAALVGAEEFATQIAEAKGL